MNKEQLPRLSTKALIDCFSVTQFMVDMGYKRTPNKEIEQENACPLKLERVKDKSGVCAMKRDMNKYFIEMVPK